MDDVSLLTAVSATTTKDDGYGCCRQSRPLTWTSPHVVFVFPPPNLYLGMGPHMLNPSVCRLPRRIENPYKSPMGRMLATRASCPIRALRISPLGSTAHETGITINKVSGADTQTGKETILQSAVDGCYVCSPVCWAHELHIVQHPRSWWN